MVEFKNVKQMTTDMYTQKNFTSKYLHTHCQDLDKENKHSRQVIMWTFLND